MLLRDEEHGHLTGIEQRPFVAAEPAEYPKWIVPHSSHIERTADMREIVPSHENHWDREGKLMVLVMDAADEESLSAAKPEAHKAEESEAPSDDTAKEGEHHED